MARLLFSVTMAQFGQTCAESMYRVVPTLMAVEARGESVQFTLIFHEFLG